MSSYAITHPAIDRLGASLDAATDLTSRLVTMVRQSTLWARLAGAIERWGSHRIEVLAMQDPRVRAEILAAAMRAERERDMQG